MSDLDDSDMNAADMDDADVDDGADPNLVMGSTARNVAEYLVKALVDDPDDVRIEANEGRTLSLQVSVGPGDMGRVIGRRGRTANAIRTIVRAAAVRDGVEVDLDFVD